MDQQAVESLEKATLAAVPPKAVEALDGWLLALDQGTVGRAHSAVPTRHERIDPAVAAAIEQRYAQHGLSAVFRVPQSAAFDGLRAELRSRGYAETQPTLTMVGQAQAAAREAPRIAVDLSSQPDEDWASVYLGEGFDPVDGASRVGFLRRSRHSVFARVRAQGEVVAVGCGCFAEGWWGVHGMRTAVSWRGRGFAAAILAALGREAVGRGIARAFLQVEQDNAAAQELYRRAGFGDAWCYEYWRR
ncbi:GNAT family N-acetyltransferase [Ramlibacter sp. Leaf400]|uniref:GNAT family N-acetyltransferase n=1 Tax=Ramlibacter sp. Leaf400 TaxID=1736365 RepID=UPI0006F21625|nr:GNAT family N-acetyltransferase [Ramlibacter sp. Leaf400]KQT10523.1 GCN5 family acetyltransferase [Ramlibacter sp. Leaf400]